MSAAPAPVPAPPARSRRRAILLLLLAATLVAAGLLADPAARIRRGVLTALSERGLRGEIARVSLSMYPGAISLEDVRVFAAGAGAGDPLLRAARVEVSFAWLPLLLGRVELDRIDLLRPELRLPLASQAAPLPATGIPASGGAWRLKLNRLRVDDGTVHLGAESWPIQGEVHHLDVDAEVDLAAKRGRASAFARSARLRLRRGVEIEGRLEARGEWSGDEIRIDAVRLASEFASADLRGAVTLASPPRYRFEGSARLPLERVARAFGGESWASGPIEGRGTIAGEGSRPAITLDLVSPALRVRGIDVGAARGRLRWEGTNLSLEGSAGDVLGGSLEARYHGARLAAGWEHRFDLTPTRMEAAPPRPAPGACRCCRGGRGRPARSP